MIQLSETVTGIYNAMSSDNDVHMPTPAEPHTQSHPSGFQKCACIAHLHVLQGAEDYCPPPKAHLWLQLCSAVPTGAHACMFSLLVEPPASNRRLSCGCLGISVSV